MSFPPSLRRLKAAPESNVNTQGYVFHLLQGGMDAQTPLTRPLREAWQGEAPGHGSACLPGSPWSWQLLASSASEFALPWENWLRALICIERASSSPQP